VGSGSSSTTGSVGSGVDDDDEPSSAETTVLLEPDDEELEEEEEEEVPVRPSGPPVQATTDPDKTAKSERAPRKGKCERMPSVSTGRSVVNRCYALSVRASLAMSFVFLAGCGTSTTDGVEDSPPRPIDERPESAFVAIVTPNGAPDYVCSGVVVAPRVVLTAGHCFSGGNYDKTGWSFEVVLGPDARDPDAIHVAVTPRLHPDYASGAVREDSSDADIAVGIAAEDLRIAPHPYARTAPPASIIGADARYAGFGAHSRDAKGERHIESARIVEVRDAYVDMTADPSPCHGDSGGPLLVRIDGVETVIGVGHTAQSDGGEGCIVGADYTRTDLFADFIASAR
jgi:V8-like Glu-specific endopeptidase